METHKSTGTKNKLRLIKQIATSGEGGVWLTDRDGLVAKIYHNPQPEKIKKLEILIANPPHDPNAKLNHVSWGWPKELIRDDRDRVVGFLMPYIVGSVEIINTYNPQRRKKLGLGIDWKFLHATALNVASIVSAIHAKGYILGDIKPQNILVNNRALPSIIDVDSFQVRDPNSGTVYRCPVGSEGFTPPELLGKNLTDTDQTEIHDHFRLAVIVYLLLFGEHPFKGKWTGPGEPPSPTDMVRHGLWCNSQQKIPLVPSPLSIPLHVVHPKVQELFVRCFDAGHFELALRPSASDWYKALRTAFSSLNACDRLVTHYYNESGSGCFWCYRTHQIKFDIFGEVNNNLNTYVVSSNDLAQLIKSHGQRVTVKGVLTKFYDGTQSRKKSLTLWFGKSSRKSSIGAFRVKLSQQCIEELIKNQSVNKLSQLVGKQVRIEGIVTVRWTTGTKKYPEMIADTLPLPDS